MMSKMEPKKTLLNIFLLAILGLPILLYEVIGTPTERGFFADDDSIAYPYKESTVSDWLLYTVGFGAPIALIFLYHIYEIKSTLYRINIIEYLQHSLSATILYLLGMYVIQSRKTAQIRHCCTVQQHRVIHLECFNFSI